MMPRLIGVLTLTILLCTACSGTVKLKYYTSDDKDADGFRFVIPRTIVKVDIAKDKSADSSEKSPKEIKTANSPADSTKNPAISFTPVPVSSDIDSGKTLSIFAVTDASDDSWYNVTPTHITNVTYADQLVIQSIGTEIMDNRKQIIGSVAALVGLATAVRLKGGDCPDTLDMDIFRPFVISNFTEVNNKGSSGY